MPNTVSGHPGRRPGSVFLATRPVPGGNGYRITADRAALPLFLDVARRLNVKVKPLSTRDCWSYNWRPIRTGSALSDHSGWAIDLWSDSIGAHTWPSKMPEEDARVIARVLERYRAADGRHIFGWGIAKVAPGGHIYTGPTYNSPAYNDPMHIFIARGVTRDDLRWCREVKGIKRDGTRKARA